MWLGDRGTDLVRFAIPLAAYVFCGTVSAQTMTALHILAICACFVFSVVLLSGAGAVALRILRFHPGRALGRWLFSITAGIVLLELAVTAGELAANVTAGVRIACVLVAVVGVFGIRSVMIDCAELAVRLSALRGTEQLLALALFVVLLLQGAASLAPMTGSDALHYHFTAQSLILREGFHPQWDLLHAFFCGLSDQIILAGLALGSSPLAQLWLFLGGAVGALATYRLTMQWVGGSWPWLAALAFALTPVTVWQATAAGAPDIWMCAFIALSLLAFLQGRADEKIGAIVLSGVLAGATAGAKYTGIALAAALLAGFTVAVPKLRSTVVFFASAVITGFAPYLRNWLWTGDPVFPFHLELLHRAGIAINATSLTSILADTGATHIFRLSDLLAFPLFASVDHAHMGAWQLLGPLVLAFSPLAIVPLRKTMEGRSALLIWVIGAICIGATSGMARFLLPLLPIALAASVAGLALLTENRYRGLRLLAQLSMAGFILAGFAAMVFYSRPAWGVVAGRTTTENYLTAHSPEYQQSQFVNREVGSFGQSGRVMVFFWHLYYLRVPFVNGDPEDSWEVDPARLQTEAAWNEFFAKRNVRWVLRSGEYPPSLAAWLLQLEHDGLLVPCATGNAETFAGNRLDVMRYTESMTLFCVRPTPAAH